MQKIAFFDFCETLVNFQTADVFVDFVRKKRGGIYMKMLNAILVLLVKLRVVAVLNRLFPEKSLGKKFKLLQIRRIPYEILDHAAALFYREMIKPNLIDHVIAELEKLAKQENEICLVSAGYSIYLKYFTQEFNIHHLISTEIAFDESEKRCTGTISGKDCISHEKVNRISAYFEGKGINLHESISFSDSMTDLPMLLLTGKAVVVSKGKSQLWCKQYNFTEIIWN